jgi:hypothetical protein
MKTLIPYIFAYLIVATCTAIYPNVYRNLIGQTPSVISHDSVAVILNPGMSRDELVAKLQQVGLSEADAQHTPIVRSAPIATTIFRIVYHYAFDAVIFAAFATLVILFQKKIGQYIPDNA